jgi:hypothetical protein
LTNTAGESAWLLSTTGAYCAETYPLAKHSPGPDVLANAWLANVMPVVPAVTVAAMLSTWYCR